MQEINVKLEIFEGPLDLLLHLIKTLEIDIYDIPISEITEQYMNYIHTMQTLELDIAGEYLVMAATLMSIKSKLLLPKQELEFEEEEEDLSGVDPRDALVAQLLEYRKFKYAASVLKEKQEERSLHYTKEPANLSDFQEERPQLVKDQISTIDLFLAFHSILERKKNSLTKETTIATDTVTVEDKMNWMDKKIKSLPMGMPLSLEECLQNYSKDEIVTTFMALLEIMKSGSVIVKQAGNYDPIFLYRNEMIESGVKDE